MSYGLDPNSAHHPDAFLPHGVIGSTIDFGSISLGSSPNEVNCRNGGIGRHARFRI